MISMTPHPAPKAPTGPLSQKLEDVEHDEPGGGN